MVEQNDWELRWAATRSGERPCKTFLERLAGENSARALALIEILQRRGNLLREPQAKALGHGLHELRSGQVRVFYMFLPGRRIVLLDGMIKKQDEIPAHVMKRLRKMQRVVVATEREVEAMKRKMKRGP